MTHLTEAQQQQWQEEGFLLLKQVLKPDEIETLLTAVDKVIETYLQKTPKMKGGNRRVYHHSRN